MSSGIFGSSTTRPQSVGNISDTGDECLNTDDQPWLHIFPENDGEYTGLAGRNLPEGFSLMNYPPTDSSGDSSQLIQSEEAVVEVSGSLNLKPHSMN